MPETVSLRLEEVSEEALKERITLRKVTAAVDMYDQLLQAGENTRAHTHTHMHAQHEYRKAVLQILIYSAIVCISSIGVVCRTSLHFTECYFGAQSFTFKNVFLQFFFRHYCLHGNNP